MASITSTGIGSGLDVANLVRQLVAAERRPTEIRIARQESRTLGQLSAFGSLKSALSSFNSQLEKMNSLETFLKRKVSSADEDVLTVSVDETAVPATYDIEVLQLAQTQKLESGSFASSTAVVGTGTLSIAVGTESFDVVIDSTNNTLEGIRDAINDAVDNEGVSATIVNGDTGSFLILTGDNTGSDQAMIITQSGGDGGLSALEYDPPNSLNSLTETRQALDAQIKVDGYTITSDNNTVVGAMDGVTLNLVAANVGNTVEVAVTNDLAAVRGQIDAFVNAYNNMISTFDNLTKFNKEAEVAAPLLGDSTIRTVRDQIRREMSIAVTDIDASFDTLSELGIDADVDGKLELDVTKLDDILATEFTKVGQLFANSDGIAVRIGAIVDGFLDEDVGLIKIRTDGLDTSIEDIADKREALNVRLDRLETTLLRQFNALDALVGQLSTTSNFLTLQLANLPKIDAFKN